MGNLQVTELYYRLETIKSTKFSSPPPVKREQALFSFSLENNKLTIKLKHFCSTEEEARNLVEDFLRSWEINDALNRGIKRINFKYENAKIIDLNNPSAVIVPGRSGLLIGVSSNLLSLEPHYPDPPTLSQISPDVRTLWHRYEGYLDHHEPLPSMAYFCLTLLEFRAGGKPRARKKAEAKYKMDYEVLEKIGELSARGDEKTARKFRPPVPLSAIETEWLKATVRKLIRRVWEIDSGVSYIPSIKMDDLPSL